MRHLDLAWFRRRQRTLTLGVLASFCLAWLQLAALPCANAYAPTVTAVAVANEAMHHTMTSPGEAAVAHCPYCPPDDTRHSGTSRIHGSCSYPHSPQVDSRLASLLTTAVPVAMPLTWLVEATDVDRPGLAPEPAAVPPRTPLAVRPSRLIE